MTVARALEPGHGALDVGAFVDLTGAGARARYLHRLSPEAAAYAEAFVEKPWAERFTAGAVAGMEWRF